MPVLLLLLAGAFLVAATRASPATTKTATPPVAKVVTPILPKLNLDGRAGLTARQIDTAAAGLAGPAADSVVFRRWVPLFFAAYRALMCWKSDMPWDDRDRDERSYRAAAAALRRAFPQSDKNPQASWPPPLGDSPLFSFSLGSGFANVDGDTSMLDVIYLNALKDLVDRNGGGRVGFDGFESFNSGGPLMVFALAQPQGEIALSVRKAVEDIQRNNRVSSLIQRAVHAIPVAGAVSSALGF